MKLRRPETGTGQRKEVILLNEGPLTPVGKIFKPALRWDAIRRVCAKEIEDRVATRLARHTIRYRLEIG